MMENQASKPEEEKVELQLPKAVVEQLNKRWSLDRNCVVDCDTEYCESFSFGKGCRHIKECKFYKEAKENEIKEEARN